MRDSADSMNVGAAGSASSGRPDLGTARLISLLMYLCVAGYVYIGLAVKLPRAQGVPAFLPGVLFAVAVAEYFASLVLERQLLAQGRLRDLAKRTSGGNLEAAAVVPAIIVSAFGGSIAVYGLVVALLSFADWPWYFYGLSVIHGIHLQLRWDRYEEAISRARS